MCFQFSQVPIAYHQQLSCTRCTLWEILDNLGILDIPDIMDIIDLLDYLDILDIRDIIGTIDTLGILDIQDILDILGKSSVCHRVCNTSGKPMQMQDKKSPQKGPWVQNRTCPTLCISTAKMGT